MQRFILLLKSSDLYKTFFILFTLAEIVFSALYYLLKRKLDNVMLIGAIIYAGGMIVGFIAYEVANYNKRKKELLDSLPD